jgi:membrane protein
MLELRRGWAAARHLIRLVVARFEEDRCVQVAGNLTFTTLLALVPTFTVAFTLFAAFPVFEDWANAFKIFLLKTLVPEVGGKIITVYMQQFSDNAARLTAVGLSFLVVTAVLLLVSIEKVFNGIWRARRPRSLVQRMLIYWTAITVGPLLIGASLSMTSWILAQSMQSVGGAKGMEEILLRTVPVLLNGAAFGLLYLTVPNRRVRIRDAFVGGIVAAAMFELMKRGFALYIELFPTYDLIYGTFATVPIFLLWLYLSWCVVLLGAVVVAILPQWRLGQEVASAQGEATFFRVLRLIEALFAARQRAAAPGTRELAATLGMLDDRVDALLEAVERYGWARRLEVGGWILAVDLQTLTLADVYRAFAFDPAMGGDADGMLALHARRLVSDAVGHLEQPLSELIGGETAPASRLEQPPPSGAQSDSG